MQQIKIFKSIEHELPSLEREINAWLVESQVEVINIVGNIAPQSTSAKGSSPGLTQSEFPPSDVIVIILYRRPPNTA